MIFLDIKNIFLVICTKDYSEDEFNANSLNFNFRGTAYEINGYKAKYRNDITWWVS